ncbi:MAG: hypothetical protein ACKV2O_17630 [Acidimicrobiales bacterium]
MGAQPIGAEPTGRTVTWIDRADGTASEVIRDLAGTISGATFNHHGTETSRWDLQIRPDGSVVVRRNVRPDHEGAQIQGDPAEGVWTEVAADSCRRWDNPYGSSVITEEFLGCIVMEQSLDDDGRLRSVRVRSPAGVDTMELHPDCSRNRTWTACVHEGSQHWNEAGQLTNQVVRFSDGHCDRWHIPVPGSAETNT